MVGPGANSPLILPVANSLAPGTKDLQKKIETASRHFLQSAGLEEEAFRFLQKASKESL